VCRTIRLAGDIPRPHPRDGDDLANGLTWVIEKDTPAPVSRRADAQPGVWMTEPRHVRRVTAAPGPPRPEGTGSPSTPLAALLGPVADVLDIAADAVPALAVMTARGARRLGLVGARTPLVANRTMTLVAVVTSQVLWDRGGRRR
jgi:hypothetical protein